MTPAKDISNIRFGSLVALNPTKERVNTAIVWLCQCDCGNLHKTSIKGLMAGTCKSCGCGEKKNRAANMKKAAGMRRKSSGESNFNNLFLSYKRSARVRGLEFNLTKEQFKDVTSKCCSYCGRSPQQYCKNNINNGLYLHNGIDRVNSLDGYVIENCVPCCSICNYAKRDMTGKEFLAWINQVYEFRNGL